MCQGQPHTLSATINPVIYVSSPYTHSSIDKPYIKNKCIRGMQPLAQLHIICFAKNFKNLVATRGIE